MGNQFYYEYIHENNIIEMQISKIKQDDYFEIRSIQII